MRSILVSTVLLTQAIGILSQEAHPPLQDPLSCEDRAKLAGFPTDGWKIVYDDAGQLKCRREDQELCHGVEYMDADTKVTGCCQDGGLTWFDTPDGKLARCCAKDHVWTYDKGENSRSLGGCCLTGSIMHNGQCIQSPGPDASRSEL